MLAGMLSLALAAPVQLEGQGVPPFELACGPPGLRHAVVLMPDPLTSPETLQQLVDALTGRFNVVVIPGLAGEQELIKMVAFLQAFTARQRSNDPLCHAGPFSGLALIGFGKVADSALRPEPEVLARVMIEPQAGFLMFGKLETRGLMVFNSLDRCGAAEASTHATRDYLQGQPHEHPIEAAVAPISHCDALFAPEACAPGCSQIEGARPGGPVVVALVVNHLTKALLGERPQPLDASAKVSIDERAGEKKPPPEPPERPREINDEGQVNLSLLLGATAYRRTGTGSEGPAFAIGFRPEGYLPFNRFGFGAFVEVSSTVGEDLVLGVGGAFIAGGGHNYKDFFKGGLAASGVTFMPGFYMRKTIEWEPGVSLGIAARWTDRFGLGIDGRLGLGPSHERALLITAQLDLLLPLMSAVFKVLVLASHGGGWIM
jgi:hypothetical protein